MFIFSIMVLSLTEIPFMKMNKYLVVTVDNSHVPTSRTVHIEAESFLQAVIQSDRVVDPDLIAHMELTLVVVSDTFACISGVVYNILVHKL